MGRNGGSDFGRPASCIERLTLHERGRGVGPGQYNPPLSDYLWDTMSTSSSSIYGGRSGSSSSSSSSSSGSGREGGGSARKRFSRSLMVPKNPSPSSLYNRDDPLFEHSAGSNLVRGKPQKRLPLR